MEHELKTDTPVFEALARGEKTCELRKDDRGFQVGDTLFLRETKYTGAEMAAGAPLEYTGREQLRLVSHVLRGYGLETGWVILSCHQLLAATQVTHGAIADVVTGILIRSRADLLALDEAGLEQSWNFSWNKAASVNWNVYQFTNALEGFKRRCRAWEEERNGSTCVVERVRDKYLMPKICEFSAQLRTAESI